MQSTSNVIAGVGLKNTAHKSRWPARLDLAQSVSGLLLGLFMWGHMFFVSSILVSEDFMWKVAKMFEGCFFFGKPYPIIVSCVVAGVIALFVTHALLAARKFPATFRQYQAFSSHRTLMRHRDTTLWWVQFLTGFALFFLASPHLFQMLVHPGLIGPYESSDRVWSGGWWPLYFILLFVVELHGAIGLYRLAVKWGWLGSGDADASRKRLSTVKWALTALFVVLGLVTLAAYMKIGYAHRDHVGERYVPAAVKAEPSK